MSKVLREVPVPLAFSEILLIAVGCLASDNTTLGYHTFALATQETTFRRTKSRYSRWASPTSFPTLVSPVCVLLNNWLLKAAGLTARAVLDYWTKTHSYIVGYV